MRRTFIVTLTDDFFENFGEKTRKLDLRVIEVAAVKTGTLPSSVVQHGIAEAIHSLERYSHLEEAEIRSMTIGGMLHKVFKAILSQRTGTGVAPVSLVCVPSQDYVDVKGLELKLDTEIARIEGDERLDYPPAQIQINAPLALIQVELKALRTAYYKVKDWLKI